MFQDTYLRKIERGIDRYSAVVSFNENFYKLRNQEQSFLSDVAFVNRSGVGNEPRQANPLSKLVINYLTETNWFNVYGLNYSETMKLTYAEWVRMQDRLNALGLKSLRNIEMPPPEAG